MSESQCHFCSSLNAADAMFCHACGEQLSLRPCPTCDAINDASALVCYACKGELVPRTVDCPPAANEHAWIRTEFDERRPDYARIGLVRDEDDPATNAVVPLQSPRPVRSGDATRFTRPAIVAGASVLGLVGIGVLLFA